MKQRNISASIQDVNEIPMATHTFLGSNNSVGLVRTLSDSGVSTKSTMVASTGSTYEITQYISFYTRYQRNSKSYTHIFGVQQLGGTIVWILSDIGVSGKSNMAANTGKNIWNNALTQLLYWTAAKFQKLHPHFRGPATQWDYSVNTVRHWCEWYCKDCRH